MSHFFVAVLLVFLGGIGGLVFGRQVKPMKILAVLGMSLGSLLGLVDAGIKLASPERFTSSFDFFQGLTLSFQMDGLSSFFLFVIFLVSFLATIYSYHYMDDGKRPVGMAANYFFFSLLVISMALVVTASNIITFMLAWEIMSLSSFFLVIYDYASEENRRAGVLYFIFSHVGAMFILAAFGLVYGYSDSFDFTGMGALPGTVKYLVFIFSFIGFGSKAGVFPFHVWLPHAHPAAPSHISAVMSGVMIKTGIYGIIRVYGLLGFDAPILGYIVLGFGVVSGVLGVVYALGQHDLKRLLAYHSVENIGIILMGFGMGMIGISTQNPLMAVLGFSGGLLHTLNHALFKSLLFMGAGMVLHKTGTRSIDALGGLLKGMKITGTTFIVGAVAISGLPPFNGFVSEFFIYISAFKGVMAGDTAFVTGVFAVIGLAVIGGLALACFTKVVGVVFQGEPRTGAAEDVNEKGGFMLAPMVALALGCLFIGVYPGAVIHMPMAAISSLGLDFGPGLGSGPGPIPVAPFYQMTGNISIGALILLGVIGLVFWGRRLAYKGKTVSGSGTWGCGFTRPTPKMQYTGSSYAGDILRFFSAVAPLEEDHPAIKGRFPGKTHYASHVHDIAERHMNRLIVVPVTLLFDKLRWIQHGDIHLYIGYILLAIVLLMFFI